MKTKHLIIFAIIFAFCSMAQAQNSDKNTHFGIKAGLDLASTTNSWNDVKSQLKGNWQAGVFMRFGKTLYFQPEIYYSQYSINDKTSAKFIKAPLMAGLKIFDLDIVAPHINVGVSYIQQLEKEYSTKGKFALEAGIGTEIFDFITADLRYTFGVVKNADDAISEINNFVANGGMLNLTVGIKF
ncbi:MAG: PorT family protein [Paludibacter sp.]|jgi:hypothetical protein|nr:PorT family protein [Paludibacter sp.]